MRYYLTSMTTLTWIILSGILMSSFALVGSVTLILKESVLQKILLPLVAFAAGSLIGGAIFHMLPESIEHIGNATAVYVTLVAGFVTFFMLEQFLHWHHCHDTCHDHHKSSQGHLILMADGLHNLIGGLAVGASFLIDIRLGIVTWIAAAAHEIPQELGDFAILVHGGWNKTKALFYNFIAALTFPIGAIAVYFLSSEINVGLLVPFAAGNFLYIAAADLIPEVKHSASIRTNIIHLLSFIAGLGLLLAMKQILN